MISQIRLICGVVKHGYAWVSAGIVGVIPHIRLILLVERGSVLVVEEALNVERKDFYHKLGL